MIIPAGFAQVNLRWTGGGIDGFAECALGFQNGSGATVNAIGTNVNAQYTANNLDDWQAVGLTYVGCLVKVGPNSTGPSLFVSTSNQGDVAGGMTPVNTAALVTKSTTLGGRQGRGRMYWPGVPESSVGDDGSLTGSYVSGLQAALTSFFTALAGLDLDHYLLHTDPATSPTLVQSVVVQSRVASQRRRLRK